MGSHVANCEWREVHCDLEMLHKSHQCIAILERDAKKIMRDREHGKRKLRKKREREKREIEKDRDRE